MNPFSDDNDDEEEPLLLQRSQTQLSDPFRDPNFEEACEIKKLFPTQPPFGDDPAKGPLLLPKPSRDGISPPNRANASKRPSKLIWIKRQICNSLAGRPPSITGVHTIRAKYERYDGHVGSIITIFVQIPSDFPPLPKLTEKDYLRVFDLVTARIPNFTSDGEVQDWLDRHIIRVRGLAQSAEVFLQADLLKEQTTTESMSKCSKSTSINGNFIMRRLQGLYKGQPKLKPDARSQESKPANHALGKGIKAFKNNR